MKKTTAAASGILVLFVRAMRRVLKGKSQCHLSSAWLPSVSPPIDPAHTSLRTTLPGQYRQLPFHLVHLYRIILPVVINHTGPYPFLLDTGAASTIVDPLLATELHLKTQIST